MKKKIFLLGIILICLVTYFIFFKETKVAVLTYHNVLPDEEAVLSNDPIVINRTLFHEQIKFLKDNYYHTLSMDEFYCFKKHKCEIPKRSVLITFDDGYLSDYLYAFDILKKYNMKATVFLTYSNINEVSENNITHNNIYKTMSLEQINDNQYNS